MRDDYHYLPGVLHEIATLAGLPAALALAEKFGGTRVHFPGRAPDGHWLVELVGREAADKLCAHFRSRGRGGYAVEIPLGPKNFYMKARKLAVELHTQGVSGYETARRIGVSSRSIRRYLEGAKEDEKQDSDQGSLF
jgi:hypothetical protein